MLCIKTFAAIWQLYNVDCTGSCHAHTWKTHRHACTCSHTIIYARRCTLIYAHTEGPQCSGHLQYWTQTQACTLYLHENALQQSAAPLVCFVPPAVWAWGRELLVRWGGGGGEPHQMGSHVYGAKRCEEREKEGGKRLPCLAAIETAGTPTYRGSGPWFGLHLWLEEQRRREGARKKAFLSGRETTTGASLEESSFLSKHNRWGKSGLGEDGWEPGLLLVGRGVIFDKCICGCGGVGVNDKKLRTAVSMHIQVTWRKDGACLYLFLVIVCRVFACPSVLAGQTWWRSRHMDQTFCPELVSRFIWWLETLIEHTSWDRLAPNPVLMVQASNPGTVLSHWGDSKIVTFTSFTCTIVHRQKGDNGMARSSPLGWQTWNSISGPSQSARLLLDFQATENRCSVWWLVNTNVNVNVHVSHALSG